MPGLDSYKIPVIQGINDVPLPPNYNGNGKSCNGAYYIEKFNNLVDLVEVVSSIDQIIQVELSYNIQNPLRYFLEIGKPFLNSGESLEISYNLSDETNNPVAKIYGGTDPNNLQEISPPFAPNDVQEIIDTPYSAFENIREEATVYYFQVRGTNSLNIPFYSDYIKITWGAKAFYGQSNASDIIDPEDPRLDNIVNSQFMLQTIEKISNDQSEYLYLFIPNNSDLFPSLTGLVDLASSFPISLDLIQNNSNKNITVTGAFSYTWPYRVFRTTYSTFGGFLAKSIIDGNLENIPNWWLTN